MALAAPLSSIFAIFLGIAYIVGKKDRPIPCCTKFTSALMYNFHTDYLNKKVQWYSFIYNLAFLIFLLFITFLGNTDRVVSELACSILAAINHYVFLVCIILSILKVFIVSQAVGNWKPPYRRFIWILTGNEDALNWPLFHALTWPLVVTGLFGLTQKDFFVRNDGL